MSNREYKTMKNQDIGTQTMLCKNDRYRSNGYRAIAMYLFSFLANRSKTNQLRLQESGFSLIESLIAVAVVSVLIVAIAPLVALSTSARINARRIDQATQSARSYLDAVRGGVVDTVAFPTSLIRNTPNAQGQYTFEAIVPPTNAPTLAATSTCSQVTNSALGSTTVLGTCVDTNGNGFSVGDPQDLFIQPMRSGPTDASELKGQGYWLAVRVYRSDALISSAAIKKGIEPDCNSGATAFASTSSILCPLITIRSQIPPVGSSININEVNKGIGSTN
jgi:prepilin-type N-terminal cleavage/methylation domain-containing protein